MWGLSLSMCAEVGCRNHCRTLRGGGGAFPSISKNQQKAQSKWQRSNTTQQAPWGIQEVGGAEPLESPIDPSSSFFFLTENQIPDHPQRAQPLGCGTGGGHTLQLPLPHERHAHETQPRHCGDHDVRSGSRHGRCFPVY